MQNKFCTYLPPEIIVNILSRLPIRTIINCKFVCKLWFDLLNTHEFVRSHLSKSTPGLVVFDYGISCKLYKIYEFDEDLLDLEPHELRYTSITKFDFPCEGWLQGSTHGLLFLRDLSVKPIGLFICNPITRDYIQLHCPQDFIYSYPQVVTFGFGTSKIIGQHKVVRIFHDCIVDETTFEYLSIPRSNCQVYTLGTGSWRSIAPGAPLVYSCRTIGAFHNGNLHWFVYDLNRSPLISCFDLETELFSTFSTPIRRNGSSLADVFVLEGYLCVCDNSCDDKIEIWLMKEYGVEKSWMKEFVISKIPDFGGESYEVVRPIKVFKNGDILMAWQDYFLFYYSNETKVIKKTYLFELDTRGSIDSMFHTSSFLSLKSFPMENVSSF